ncbi:N-acetylmuramoyl-L-alanine amidase [Flavobacterium sp.]|uniref:N-acetylmuramoyl-L-alanine amidase n=1 Tax=Flavobacterium sp. TaxID=239 RepID=UPI002FD96F05
MYDSNKFKFLFLTVFLLIVFSGFSQNNSKFKVVLDAGHGGKDFGTIHHGYVEKKIVLNVTLLVGKLLEKHNDIQVVYTRKTDVFIELKERANIANRADANLFVSIHCNGVNNYEPYGTETFVMGLTRNATNLEVAKKENSVITLESDYKVKYAGFDPNNPLTLTGLKLIQEENLDQSISLASKIQDNFTNNLGRKNRGVKQAPIWVLDATVMPGILVELGFVSNKKEGEYLNSDKGQEELAKAIAEGILKYKKEYYGTGSSVTEDDKPSKPSTETLPKEQPKVIAETPKPKSEVPVAVKEEPKVEVKEPAVQTGVVFKVQISASGKLLDLVPQNFNGLSPISMLKENGLIKYFFAEETSYEQAKRNLQEAKSKGYESAFIVAFQNGKKISIQEALKK